MTHVTKTNSPSSVPASARRVASRWLVCSALLVGLGPAGCNMFASFATKARATVNTLGKRNVDFDRPAPAEKDLEQIHTVAIKPLQGRESDAQMIAGYLASYLSDSERFTLVSPESLVASAPAQPVVAAAVDPAAVDADAADADPVEAPQPAPATGTATIEGSIVQANYDERMDSQTAKCGENKTCTTKTRIGTAVVTVNLKLVDATSGEVLVQKTLEERKETKVSARDSQPPSIDGKALLDEASRTVAGQFFAAVSPHVVQETVFFETDNKAKSLKEGANRAMGGDLPGAIEAFEQGLAEASAKRDEKALAKANFDLGLALVIDGEYDKGLDLLRKAQRPKSKKAWSEIIVSAQRWKSDAQQAGRQWEANKGDAPTFEPTVRQSEGATKEGAGTVKALRTVAGR